MENEYPWDAVNATQMGEYLTLHEVTFINKFLYLKPIQCCLDIACGSGRFSSLIENKGIFVIAVDMNRAGLELMKSKIQKNNIELVQADATHIPLKEGTFDAIISIETIDYLNAEHFLQSCSRILKIGGSLLFTSGNRNSYKMHLHSLLGTSPIFYRYSTEDIRHILVGCGFRIDYMKGFNWIPFKRNSDSKQIPFFAFIEKLLSLSSYPSLSPWVFFVATKKGEE